MINYMADSSLVRVFNRNAKTPAIKKQAPYLNESDQKKFGANKSKFVSSSAPALFK